MKANNKRRCVSLALCFAVCLALAGCEAGAVQSTPASTATEQAPAPAPTPEATAEAVPEAALNDVEHTVSDAESAPDTPEPAPTPTPAPSGLPVAAITDSAGMVMSAVVGGYYVYHDGGRVYAVPCDNADAEPVVLHPDTIPFHVWNGYVVAYAKPDDNTPFRYILISPDGSERRVIDKRQSEFYSPIGGLGDYCYGYVNDRVVRYSLSGDKVERMYKVKGSPVGIMDGCLYSMYYWTDTVWRYDLETGEGMQLFSDADKARDYTAIAMRGFILINGPQVPTFALLPNGTVHKLFDGSVTVREPWASTPDCIYVAVHEGDVESPVIGTYCVTADGVYPMEDYALGVRVQSGANGGVYLPGVDVDGIMPMSGFPIVMEQGVPNAGAQ